MPATCLRTTRPATGAELARLQGQGKARGMVGCLGVAAVPVVVVFVLVGQRFGILFGAGVLVLAAIVLAAFLVSFSKYLAPIRGRIRQDVAAATVEVLAITSAVPLSVPATHSSVDPAFAIELEGGRTLVLLGQWLSDPATFGGTQDDLAGADDDAGDPFANALPPPYTFPTRAFSVHRFPVSGEVVRIDIAGEYVEPPALAGNVDLRAVNDFPSRIYDTVPSRLSEVLPR
jgi:hypothetical protein